MNSSDIRESRHPFDLSLVISLWQDLSVTTSSSSSLQTPGFKTRDNSSLSTYVWQTEPCHKTSQEEKEKRADVSTICLENVLLSSGLGNNHICETSNVAVIKGAANTHMNDYKVSSTQNKATRLPVDARNRHVAFYETPKAQNVSSRFKPVVQMPDVSHYTPRDRRTFLMQKLVEDFPRDVHHLLRHKPPHSVPSTSYKEHIHVFVDHSNILIGFYDTIKAIYGYGKYERMMKYGFSFHNLSMILERGRPFLKRVLAGSSQTSTSILEARKMGYETCVLERVLKQRDQHNKNYGYTSSSDNPSAKLSKYDKVRKVEQAVDDIIYLKILESLLDYPPATLVIGTGDANPAEYSPGFFKAVDRSISLGWKVELIAFNESIGKAWRKDHGWGSNFEIFTLDSYIMGLIK